MKRLIFVGASLLTVFATLFLLFTPVAAEGARSIKLIGIDHWNSKGLVLHFLVNGKYSPEELDGIVHIGNRKFNMDCNFANDELLNCVVGDAIAQQIGKSAYLVMGGYYFSFTVPAQKNFSNCQDVWALLVNNFDTLNQYLESGTNITINDLLKDYTHPEVVAHYCLPFGDTAWPDTITFAHPQQAQLEQLLPGLSIDLSHLPAMLVDPSMLPAGYEDCIPAPAYHGEGSIIWHELSCTGTGIPQ